MKHVGLDAFYQPGGHFEKPEETPRAVAHRHLSAALGNSSFTHFSTDYDPDVPIDIDTHPIPACGELQEEQHYHHDFRYLFFLDETVPLKQSEDGKRWENLNELSRRETFKKLVPKILQAQEEHQTRSFFDDVSRPLRELPRVSCVTVAHLIPDVFPYLRAINGSFNPIAIIPKQNSIVDKVKQQLERSWNIRGDLKREVIANGNQFGDLLSTAEGKFVLFDIGGYFSPVVHKLAKLMGNRFVGIVEDTENGHQKYLKVAEKDPLPVPVISVARSPLKDNEDFLVGQSILFSADFVLRQVGQLIQYLQCGIFGYGKIGSSIAHHLLLRGVKPWVYDDKPIPRARAVNQLCNAPPRDYIIKNADVIFSATGNQALKILDFRALKSGCFVVSVTSSEDEMDLTFLEGEYTSEEVQGADHVTKWSSFTNFFYLVNKGNAVNFIHNAVLGDAIHLVRGEMLHAAYYLLSGRAQPGLIELPKEEREQVVAKWLRAFVDQRNSALG